MPRGSQHLGVSIVEGDTLKEAMQRAYRLRCNPGGQVQAGPLVGEPPVEMRDRALTRDEIAKYGESTRKDH